MMMVMMMVIRVMAIMTTMVMSTICCNVQRGCTRWQTCCINVWAHATHVQIGCTRWQACCFNACEHATRHYNAMSVMHVHKGADLLAEIVGKICVLAQDRRLRAGLPADTLCFQILAIPCVDNYCVTKPLCSMSTISPDVLQVCCTYMSNDTLQMANAYNTNCVLEDVHEVSVANSLHVLFEASKQEAHICFFAHLDFLTSTIHSHCPAKMLTLEHKHNQGTVYHMKCMLIATRWLRQWKWRQC